MRTVRPRHQRVDERRRHISAEADQQVAVHRRIRLLHLIEGALRDEPRDASRVTGLAVRITAGGLPLARSPSSFCSLSTVMSPAEVGIVYVPVCTVAVVLESKS